MSDLPASVAAMVTDDHAPTAPLADFLKAYRDDDNLWWQISCGHHQNLFDAAVEALERVEAMADEALAELDRSGE